MPFCIECGTEYSAGKFCSSCGAAHEQVHTLPENNAILTATSASLALIKLCETDWKLWPDDHPTVTDFQAFTVGDWLRLGTYLRERYQFAFGERTKRGFDSMYASSDEADVMDLEASERIAEEVENYIDSLDPSTQQLQLLAAAGFLAGLPYPIAWKSEHITKELDVIFNTLGVGSVSSRIGKSFDGVIPALSGLSDFGLSALVPYLGQTADERSFLETLAPTPGEVNISMASLLYLNNPAARHRDVRNVLISPRTLHLLFDDSNYLEPWWVELELWGRAGLADPWKGHTNVSIQDWDLDQLVALASNGLDGKLYPDASTYKSFMRDRDVFENFLTFLKGP
jgi:hypothetical protein